MKQIIFAILLTTMLCFAENRSHFIENFDDSLIVLHSYDNYDSLNNWELDTTTTYSSSAYALYLKGNNSIYQNIEPLATNQNAVWQIAAQVTQSETVIAFGIGDSLHTLFYTFKGTTVQDSLNWVETYQGSFPNNHWNLFELSIGSDWFAHYDYYPVINRLFYINKGTGKVYFDEISDISEDIPDAPIPDFSYTINKKQSLPKSIIVQFSSSILNSDTTQNYTYHWQFGDDSTSTKINPSHIYNISDNRSYHILLGVKSSTGKIGYVTKEIILESGESSLPLTINFVGDVMLAGSVESQITQDGYQSIFDETRSILNEADLSVANLENPLTTATTYHPTKPIVFKGKPTNVRALQDAGIDAVSLANNHIYDYLVNGLLETQQTLDGAEILYSGAGINAEQAGNPLIINKKGINLAFIAASDRTGTYNNYQPFLQAGYNKPGFNYLIPSQLSRQLQKVEGIADLKIVEMHSGSEYSLTPSSNYDKSDELSFFDDSEDEDAAPKADYPRIWDIKLRHFAIDQGADIVINHHPHIIQGFEIYKNKLIAHSLGNFVFDLGRMDTKPTIILKTKIDENGFYDYQVIPAFIDQRTPRLLKGETALKLLDYLAWRSKQLNTYFITDRNNFTAKIVADTTALENYFISQQCNIDMTEDNLLTYPIQLKRDGDLALIKNIYPQKNWQYHLGRSQVWFGGFENPDFNQWSESPNAVFDSVKYYSGNYSMRLTALSGNTAATTTLYNHRRMSTDQYSINGFLSTVNADSINIRVDFYTSPYKNDNPISCLNIPIQVNNNRIWTQFYHDITFPANSTAYKIKLFLKGKANLEANVWFDNVDLVQWDSWQEDAKQAIPLPNGYNYLQLKSDLPVPECSVDYIENSYKISNIHQNENSNTVQTLKLSSNYPNPFNSTTNIRFENSINEMLELSIYNINGQKVRTLVNAELVAGNHSVQWNGNDFKNTRVASGVYFYCLKSAKFAVVNKLLLLK